VARAAVAAPAAVGSAKAIVTWDPKRAMAYECMSFLPDLTDAQIAKQVDYMIGNGWTPCVEFEDRDKAIAKIDTSLGPGYYHNRYWNMWKLPLFGCTDGTPSAPWRTSACPSCPTSPTSRSPSRSTT
jgi:ribulose-bisphosphate carboxylase small chain